MQGRLGANFQNDKGSPLKSFQTVKVFPLGKIGEDVEQIGQFTIEENGNHYRQFGKLKLEIDLPMS